MKFQHEENEGHEENEMWTRSKSSLLTMKYRKLRIAWSVVCGIFFLLLIALWVRSYWWWDYATIAVRTGRTALSVQSVQGQLFAFHAAEGWSSSERGSIDLKKWNFPESEAKSVLGFSIEQSPIQTIVTVPYWFALAFAGCAAAIPWLPWHFSLRTLLIAMTLATIALGLGLAVYAAR